MTIITRRTMLIGSAAAALSAAVHRPALAHNGLLAKLQSEKKARIGIANQMPFSVLNSDGTMSGIAPEVAKVVLNRLGITEIEGFVGTYGELIPGLYAGRWDFIAASMTTTAARCTKIQFADPLVYNGFAIAYVKKPGLYIPKSVADLKGKPVKVGSSDGNILRKITKIGLPREQISLYPNELARVDALLAHRVDYSLHPLVSIKPILAKRKLEDKIGLMFPIADIPAHGSSCAFRLADTDLHAAFQREFRAIKKSGEFAEIAKRNGIDIAPEVWTFTNEDTCKIA